MFSIETKVSNRNYVERICAQLFGITCNFSLIERNSAELRRIIRKLQGPEIHMR